MSVRTTLVMLLAVFFVTISILYLLNIAGDHPDTVPSSDTVSGEEFLRRLTSKKKTKENSGSSEKILASDKLIGCEGSSLENVPAVRISGTVDNIHLTRGHPS